MKKLLGLADTFMRHTGWQDLGLIKFCLCAAGVMLGLATPNRLRKVVAFGSVAVFLATYIPLMQRFSQIFCSEETETTP